MKCVVCQTQTEGVVSPDFPLRVPLCPECYDSDEPVWLGLGGDGSLKPGEPIAVGPLVQVNAEHGICARCGNPWDRQAVGIDKEGVSKAVCSICDSQGRTGFIGPTDR